MAQQPEQEDEEFKSIEDEVSDSADNAEMDDADDPGESGDNTVDDVEVVVQDDVAQDEEVAEDVAEDDAADEKPEEELPYSKKVAQRISREIKLRRDSEAQAAEERKSRFASELKTIEATRYATDTAIENIDFKIEKEQARLKKAIEEGETDEQVKAQSELAALTGKKNELSGIKGKLDERENEVKTQAQAVPQKVPPLAQQWMSRNKWFKDPKFFSETIAVRSIDANLAKAGMNVNDPEYYRALDREIQANMPDLKDKVARVFKTNGRATVRSSVAPVSRSGAAPVRSALGQQGKQGKMRVIITAEDKETMRNFKLDPGNPEHLKEFARNKARA